MASKSHGVRDAALALTTTYYCSKQLAEIAY
jgi:hypothetical protein